MNVLIRLSTRSAASKAQRKPARQSQASSSVSRGGLFAALGSWAPTHNGKAGDMTRYKSDVFSFVTIDDVMTLSVVLISACTSLSWWS